MTVAGIDVLQTQGNLQSTGKTTDMAIQATASSSSRTGPARTTRVTAPSTSPSMALLATRRAHEGQGWQADANGKIDITQPLTNLVIPIGQRTTALATSHVTLSGNLDAGATAAVAGPPAVPATTVPTTMTVFDSLGVSHSVKVTFTKTGANAWSWAATSDPTDAGNRDQRSRPGSQQRHSDLHERGVFSVSTGTLAFTFPTAQPRPRRRSICPR